MRVAHITTINTLTIANSYNDILFCLAPYCKNKKYKQFFKSIQKFIIIDNGVAENILISDKKLVGLAIEIKANEIIIPDIIGNYEETKNKREKFLNKYYQILKKNKIKIQSVIQGDTIEEYEQCLAEVNKDTRIDVIGVPFRINYCKFKNKTKNENCMLNRIYFLNTHNFYKPVHCLGCNLLQELKRLQNFNGIRSIDSKLVARYSKALRYLNFNDKNKPKVKLYITDELNDKQKQCLQINLDKLENG